MEVVHFLFSARREFERKKKFSLKMAGRKKR